MKNSSEENRSTDRPHECYFRESHYCTFGHAGSVITIEEDYNENGKIAVQASIGGVSLRMCDTDDCSLLKQDKNEYN